MAVEQKYCNKCTSTKEASSFGKCSRNNDGLQSWCKECRSFHQKSKQKIFEDGTMQIKYKPSLLKNIKEFCCLSCNKVKSKNEFYKRQNKCKTCIKESRASKYNSDEDYRLKVREYQNQRPERSEYNTRYHNERYQNDPVFRLTKNIRTRITSFVSKGKKLGSTKELLGCNGFYLKEYLKSKFKTGMTLENYGKVWEIDHIKPCASFDLTKESEQRKCFHYTNLQPLFATTEIAIQHGHMNEIGNRNKQHKLI